MNLIARRSRICPAGYEKHIVQRGNNRCCCLVREDDYVAYAHWLAEASAKSRNAFVDIFLAPHYRRAAGTDKSGDGQIGRGGLPLEECVPAWPDRDGTTHVVFERGGLASNSRCRKRITPTSSVKVKKTTTDVVVRTSTTNVIPLFGYSHAI